MRGSWRVALLGFCATTALIASPATGAEAAHRVGNATHLTVIAAGASRTYAAGTTASCRHSAGGVSCGKATVMVLALRPDGRRARGFGANGIALVHDGAHSINGMLNGPHGSLFIETVPGAGRGEVTKLDRHGSPAQDFGSSGTAALPVGFSPADGSPPMALDDDRSLLLAGSSSGDSANPDLAVVRLLSSGAVDTSFGSDGVAAIENPPEGPRYAASIGLTATGQIRLAGGQSDFSIWEPMIAGLTPAGELDPSFGAGGVRVLGDAPAGDLGSTVDTGLAIDGHGRVLAVGGLLNGTGYGCSPPVVTRLTPSGDLDTSFADGGYLSGFTPVVGDCVTSSGLIVDARDRPLLAAGFYYPDHPNTAALVRLTRTGQINTRFGGKDGFRSFRIRGNRAFAEAVTTDPRGRVLVAGTAVAGRCKRRGHKPKPCDAGAVARFSPNGKKDHTFGRGAAVTLPAVLRP